MLETRKAKSPGRTQACFEAFFFVVVVTKILIYQKKKKKKREHIQAFQVGSFMPFLSKGFHFPVPTLLAETEKQYGRNGHHGDSRLPK